MRNSRLNFKHIAALACQRADDLVPKIVGDGKRLGREWIAKNPRRNDQSLGSFKINLETGRWADFATGDRGGDLISLTAYINGTSQLEAAKKLRELIGE